MKEPGDPHAAARGQQDRLDPLPERATVPGLPPQGTTAPGVQEGRDARQGDPWRVAAVGATLPHSSLRPARSNNHATLRGHRDDPRSRAFQCPRRVDQHEDPAPDPYRLRLSLSRGPHQPDYARSRRTDQIASPTNEGLVGLHNNYNLTPIVKQKALILLPSSKAI